MGNIQSAFRRQEGNAEDIEMDATGAHAGANPYRYPPKSGELYFGNSFWIGGERFDMDSSDSFLFGENHDVNFIAGRPAQFRFRVPRVGEPISVLQSLVNIRKDTLKLVRSGPDSDQYGVEFTYDSDVPFAVSVYFLASEHVQAGGLSYHATCGDRIGGQHASGGFGAHYKSRGTVQPSTFNERQLMVPSDGPTGTYPMVVVCEVDENDLINQQSHSHILIANLEKTSDGTFSAKTLKQKQEIDSTVFLLQEIFGLDGVPSNMREGGETSAEGGTGASGGSGDNDSDGLSTNSQTGMECELCLSEPRDTLILPCRHLSICSSCADQLRYTASSCPFCRQPFSALVHIRAYKEVAANIASDAQRAQPVAPAESSDVPGYLEVPLLEAVHGASSQPASAAVSPARTVTKSDVAESPVGDELTGAARANVMANVRAAVRTVSRESHSPSSDSSVVPASSTSSAADGGVLDGCDIAATPTKFSPNPSRRSSLLEASLNTKVSPNPSCRSMLDNNLPGMVCDPDQDLDVGQVQSSQVRVSSTGPVVTPAPHTPSKRVDVEEVQDKDGVLTLSGRVGYTDVEV